MADVAELPSRGLSPADALRGAVTQMWLGSGSSAASGTVLDVSREGVVTKQIFVSEL